MNQVQLIGRLAREVTLTEISNNRQVINTVAIDRKGKMGLTMSTSSQYCLEWDG